MNADMTDEQAEALAKVAHDSGMRDGVTLTEIEFIATLLLERPAPTMTELQRWNLFVYYANEAGRKYLTRAQTKYFRWFGRFGVFAVKAENAWSVTLRNPND